MKPNRREFTSLLGSATAALAVGAGCDLGAFVAQSVGRLTKRPKAGVKTTVRGHVPLKLGGLRDGWLDVPSAIPANEPMPLAIMLHGAGGAADRFRARFNSIPETAGVAALWVDSRGDTWDAIRGGFGPDVAFLDRAIDVVSGWIAVDPKRLAVGGFSDGATYALSLGLINGDLFPKIVAFSPGFIVDGELHGRPNVFISHGIADDILPIDRCSRVIVPALRQRGYGVSFREFDGRHEVPPAVATEAFNWVAAK